MSTVPDRLRERVVDTASALGAMVVPEAASAPRWSGGLSALLVAAGSVLALGPLGALAGAAVVGCWYAYSTEAAFALGVLLLAVAGTPSVGFALAAVGLLGVLLSPLLAAEGSFRALMAFFVFLASCLAVAWLAFAWAGAAWAGALGLAVWVACVAYGLHRYSLLATGLLDSTEADDTDGSDAANGADDAADLDGLDHTDDRADADDPSSSSRSTDSSDPIDTTDPTDSTGSTAAPDSAPEGTLS